jgi:hypothetical protein
MVRGQEMLPVMIDVAVELRLHTRVNDLESNAKGTQEIRVIRNKDQATGSYPKGR